jgi:SlyX protein
MFLGAYAAVTAIHIQTLIPLSQLDHLRLEELESRMAFLDDTVEQLNAVIVRQDQEIRLLQQQLNEVVARMADMSGVGPESQVGQQHEIPPHY